MECEEYDYEEELEEDENLSYGEQFEILLLEPYNGGKIGDVITVYRGIYNTLINLKKGLPMNCYEELPDNQKLAINAKNLEEEVVYLQEYICKLEKEIESLKFSKKDKSHQNYNNKMIVTKRDK